MSQARSIPAPALLALTYLTWIALGATLLRLPIASDGSVTWSDAVFTATSAVTVTGLVVFDAGTTLTIFGQAVLMLLIQLGGMGLMTFAVLILSSFGLTVGLAQRSYLREEMGLNDLSGLLSLAWIIFRIVLACELAGLLCLSLVFVPEFGWRPGLWQALFHSISAFNNAGFSLFSNSLMNYTDSPVVLLTISAQFIVGGIGFAVISDVFSTKRWGRFSLHTRLMLTGTLALALLSVGGFAALEWNNPGTLGTLSTNSEKLLVAWFEGMTPRTAGFNSVDTAAMNDSTTLMTMVLMAIGGGSTSTAGGVKVTTAVVLLLATIAFFRHSGQMRCFGYSIDMDVGVKVMALLTISVIVLTTGTFAILATHDIRFIDAAFEVFSAFGTVGLSRGATSELNTTGRCVICTIMFLGRLGPLTLGFFLASKIRPPIKYPPGQVFLG